MPGADRLDRGGATREGVIGGEEPLDDLVVAEAAVGKDGHRPAKGGQDPFVVEELLRDRDHLPRPHPRGDEFAVLDQPADPRQRQAKALGQVGDGQPGADEFFKRRGRHAGQSAIEARTLTLHPVVSVAPGSRTAPVGEVIDGRYRVLEHLATGGMAAVYLATDLRLEREVALKIMRADLATDEAFVSRFRREARAAARLAHPNVVAVLDQGEQDSMVWLAMEYVPGRTLRQVLTAEGPLSPRAALDLLEPMLTGLASAHDAGYIHRDIKPENVLLREDGVVKVADFGLARAVHVGGATATSGVILGTVSYLSPEQVERGIADARSDVYASGLLLYELLTGRRAVDGENPVHVAFQHVHESVPAPSLVVPDLPRELDDLVELATHRDPDERPNDARALLAEVHRTRALLNDADLDTRPQAPAVSAAPVATRQLPPSGVSDKGTAVVPLPPKEIATTKATGKGDRPPPSAAVRARRRTLLRSAVVAALLILALVTGGVWYYALGPGSPTVVPTLEGKNQSEVEALLGSADLRLSRKEAYDEDIPRGIVITTNPVSGAEVNRRSDVIVTFSRGPERYEVPSLAGATEKEAKDLLAKDHLAVGNTTRQYSETVAKGRILRTDPDTGTSLRPDSRVNLVVSRGPEPITVPTVVGKAFDEAESALTGVGLKAVRGTEVFDQKVPKGAVVRQDPGADGTVRRGTEVTLTISKGPEMVTIPKVMGMSRAAATRELEAAGLKVRVQAFLGGPLDEVRAVDPKVGASVPKGSTVTLLIV